MNRANNIALVALVAALGATSQSTRTSHLGVPRGDLLPSRDAPYRRFNPEFAAKLDREREQRERRRAQQKASRRQNR